MSIPHQVCSKWLPHTDEAPLEYSPEFPAPEDRVVLLPCSAVARNTDEPGYPGSTQRPAPYQHLIFPRSQGHCNIAFQPRRACRESERGLPDWLLPWLLPDGPVRTTVCSKPGHAGRAVLLRYTGLAYCKRVQGYSA